MPAASRAKKEVMAYRYKAGKSAKGKSGSSKDIPTGGNPSGGKGKKPAPITPGYESDAPKTNDNAGTGVDYGKPDVRKKAGAME